MCTPFIVRWPGRVAPGTIVHEPGHVVDFMPTLLELAGVTYPETTHGRPVPPMAGRSLLPVLRRQPAPPRHEPIYFWEFRSTRALRDGPWKIVWGSGEKRWQLYDLSTDRTETTDLAGHHPDRLQQLVARWEAKARTIAPPDYAPGKTRP